MRFLGNKTSLLGMIAAAFLFFAMTDLPSGLCGENGEGQALYQQAMQFFEQSRFAEAEELLTEALRYEPSNADYHFQLSNVYAATYDSWLARPNAPQAIEILGRLQRALEQTLIFSPDHLAAHFNLGVLHKRQGRYEEARDEFRSVLDLSPDLAAAWFQMGSTYQAQGFWDEAEDAYIRARELSYNPYEINQVLQDMQGARIESERASSRSPGFGSLGSAFGQQNQMGSLGGAQSLYGGIAGAANQQSTSPTSVMPSLAAMMIQQMLSRQSSNDGNTQ